MVSHIKVTLTRDEVAVAIAALHTYRFETQQYLRTYSRDDSHDDCCGNDAWAPEALRTEHRVALEERLREIDGALLELDSAVEATDV